jgi:nucleotide-binding universal stress UspA family protein
MSRDGLPVIAGVAGKDPAVLAYAQDEAARWDVPLVLVHTYVVPPSAMGSIYGFDVPAAYRDGADQVMDEAVAFVRSRNPHTPLETRVSRETAFRALERLAPAARVLVIGQDTRKSWAVRLFEGRTAKHLVQHAACPVAIVNDAWQRTIAKGSIVALIDGVTLANGSLRYSFEEARRRGGRVRVVQADTTFETAADLDEHRARLSRLMESWRAWYPDVRVRTTVLTGDPEDVGSDSEGGAELLVVSRSIGEPHLWPSHSAARSIAQEARCPVVVVPAGYDN